jgi:hypothetical protein
MAQQREVERERERERLQQQQQQHVSSSTRTHAGTNDSSKRAPLPPPPVRPLGAHRAAAPHSRQQVSQAPQVAEEEARNLELYRAVAEANNRPKQKSLQEQRSIASEDSWRSVESDRFVNKLVNLNPKP